MKHRVLLLGAGKIGRMIARLLVDTGDYDVVVGDVHEPSLERIASRTGVATLNVDATDRAALDRAMQGRDTVISALSFHHNPLVAEAALAAGVNYFDLTEDMATTRRVREIAAQAKPGQIFMPQCGLAPGLHLDRGESLGAILRQARNRPHAGRRSCRSFPPAH